MLYGAFESSRRPWYCFPYHIGFSSALLRGQTRLLLVEIQLEVLLDWGPFAIFVLHAGARAPPTEAGLAPDIQLGDAAGSGFKNGPTP